MSVQTYPPGPKSAFWGLDFIPRFAREPLAFLTEVAQQDGDLLHYQMGPIHGYLVKHPDLVHEVLVKNAKSFHKWERQKRVFGKFDGNGLVNSDGDFWKRQRKLAQPAFHSQRIGGYAQTMVEITRRHMRDWRVGQTLDMQKQMTQITRDIVTKTLFNADVSAETERISECIEIIQQMAFREFGAMVVLPDAVGRLLPWRRHEYQAMADLDAIIYRMIRERRASEGQDFGDLLSMLLLAEDENGERMTEVQARDEAMTLFLAGHETSAAALVWACYVMAVHPEVQGKLRDEAQAVLGERPATFDDLPRLVYTGMVIKETMRLYPPTWLFPREAAEDVQIGGYVLRKKSLVHLVPYLLHRDARFWDDPLAFRPERFTPENEARLHKFVYFPFGGGPRVCIGNSFAMMEMQLILATLAQQFSIRLAAGQGTPREVPLITLQPEGGLQVMLGDAGKSVTQRSA